mgnify:FL=1
MRYFFVSGSSLIKNVIYVEIRALHALTVSLIKILCKQNPRSL